MDFIVVGAGSIGAVVGTLLEHGGHRVMYWARAGQAQSAAPFEIQRDGGVRIRSAPLQWIDATTSPMPPSDWILVCVRTEQLTAALAQVVRAFGTKRSVALATVTIDGAFEAARAAGLRGRVLALHVSFGSGFAEEDPRKLTWFPFTPPSTVSAEGQVELRGAARELARELTAAGLPTSATLDMGGIMRVMVVANCALMPSWALCDWDIARLARDRKLRVETARAMHEAVRGFAPERGVARFIARALPLAAYALLLRILPRLMGKRAATLWLIHGPKIDEQTAFVLNELIGRADRMNVPLEHLTTLTARWQTARKSTVLPFVATGVRA
jgi:ketopantoate reductase